MVTLVLPFPISSNRMWRRSGSRIHLSKGYVAWKKEADDYFIQQKRGAGTPIKGNFTYHITLDQNRRKKASDGDNRCKVVLDYLQRVGLIENDKLADGGSWAWGRVDDCFVRVFKSGERA